MTGTAPARIEPRQHATGRRAAGALLLTLLMVMLNAGSPAHATGTPEERAAALIGPSVVYIHVDWSAWVYDGYNWLPEDNGPYRWSVRCSGVVVSPDGYIATAGHCVDPGPEGARGEAWAFAVDEAFAKGWQQPGSTWGQLYRHAAMNWRVEGDLNGSPPDRTVTVELGASASGLATGQSWPARVVDLLPLSEGDVAVLKIEEADLSTGLLAPPEEIGIGMPVLSVGYPASSDRVVDATYDLTFKDGKINSKKTRDNGLLPVYEISAAVSGGMSGGPVVDLDGRIIGLNSFTIAGESQAFNFLTPSVLVSEMLARAGVTNSLGPIDGSYHAGVEAFFSGDPQAAVEAFDRVLASRPSHQQAQELRRRAQAVVDSQPVPDPAEPPEPPVDTEEIAPPVRVVPEPPEDLEPTEDISAVPALLAALLTALAAVFVLAVAVGLVLWRRRRVARPAPTPHYGRTVHMGQNDPLQPTGPRTEPAPEPAPTEPAPTVDLTATEAPQTAPSANGWHGAPVPGGATQLLTAPPEVVTRRCPECDTVAAAAARFCAQCGTSIA